MRHSRRRRGQVTAVFVGFVVVLLTASAGRAQSVTFVNFDLSSHLNADVVCNNGGILDTSQSAVDGNGHVFPTQSVALAFQPGSPDGLPDNGFFPLWSPSVGVRLNYNNGNDGDNARSSYDATDTFTFDVGIRTYLSVHLFATAGGGDANVTVQLNYTGTTTTSLSFVVPDWASGISDPAVQYVLIGGRDRISTDGSVYSNTNNSAIFGFRIPADPSRTLESVTVTRTDATGVLSIFGAAGEYSTDQLLARPSYSVLLDLDDDPATGCSVTHDGETFAGADQMLVTTQGEGVVTSVVRQVCVDPATGRFGFPIPVEAPFQPPWPVGVGAAADGSNVIETYVPMADIGAPFTLRMGFAATGPSGEDALYPARLFEVERLVIPALSVWGLLALVVLLAGTAAMALRTRGRTAAGVAVFVTGLLLAGVACAAIVLDGQPGDWAPADLMGTDPVDGPGADLRAAFARLESGILYFRVDASDQACSADVYDGNFVVVVDRWGDYATGAIVPVEHVPGTDTFRILSTNNPYISNSGTSYMEVTLEPASSTVTLVSNECFDYGPGFCLNVTGAGVASCDGTIDVIANYGGFVGYRFILQPQ